MIPASTVGDARMPEKSPARPSPALIALASAERYIEALERDRRELNEWRAAYLWAADLDRDGLMPLVSAHEMRGWMRAQRGEDLTAEDKDLEQLRAEVAEASK